MMNQDVAAPTRSARSLIDDTVVVDAIVPWTDYGDAALRATTLPRYRAAGYGLVGLSLASDKEGTAQLVHAIGRVRREVLAAPDLGLADSVDDIEVIAASGRMAIWFNLQGSGSLGGDIGLVEVYHRLGIRQIILAYNYRNAAADGCHERTDSGLSTFGLSLVAEMNRVGVAVDCTHMGTRSSIEAIEASTAPAIFSHSNAKALLDHDRNITDEQARRCAERGGWIGVNGVGIFLGDDDSSSETFFRHVDHYAQLIGTEAIGIGTDYVYDVDDMQTYMRSVKSPERGNYDRMYHFFQPEQIEGLVEIMLRHGYPDPAIHGILGANYLRTMRAIERCAGRRGD